MGNGHPLTRSVATGGTTEVRLEPFTVLRVDVPSTWDPEEGALPVAYRIVDRHRLIRHGRLVVRVGRPTASVGLPDVGEAMSSLVRMQDDHVDWTVVHRLELKPSDLTQGSHRLEASDRWDGIMTEGPWAHRRVSFEQAWLRIEVIAWDAEEADPERSPGVPPRGWRSADQDDTCLALVRQARWGRTFAIPYGDPQEPRNGEVELSIDTRSVPDGTPVALIVARIGDIRQAGTDRVYAIAGIDDERQPGLAGLVVRDGHVRTANGQRPVVRFDEYDEHWKYEGNNFYGAWARFGDGAPFVPVTERDHARRERDVLHFRFTVFIHAAPTQADAERVRTMQALRDFISRETRWFRPYFLSRTLQSPATLRQYFRHRYVVLYLGHAWADCWHPRHERMQADAERPRDMPHQGFPPDRNVCPDRLIAGQEHTLEEARAEYARFEIQLGCGHGDAVRHLLLCLPLMYGTARTGSPGGRGFLQIGSRGEHGALDHVVRLQPDEVPRFHFHLGGCRTFLTDRLAQALHTAGTKHVTGWVYTVGGPWNTTFVDRLFRQWLKPEGLDPSEYDEWDETRFLRLMNAIGGYPERQVFEPRHLSAAGRRAMLPESCPLAEAVD